ncbi:MAG: lipase family protein [Bacteroidales bacterium]|nr:lipase family protein [Bacteroidota bacterium]MBL6950317.1 lipase family protein [Bacteroidales bacterium]
MKKLTVLATTWMVSMILIFSSGCKKNPANYNPLPPPGIEEPNIPGVIMTLAAISYVAEGTTPTIIKDSIRILLADTSLATGGKWDLAWGPGISPGNANLVFIARSTTYGSSVYCIAIRGTSVKSIQDILEDLIAFSMIQFPYGEAGDSVAKGMMEGFTALLLTKDPEKGTTLEEFLQSIPINNKVPLYITGHSQGGGLAPLMTYWLVTNELLKDKFEFNTYTFAGPGIVNKSFRDNFMNILPPDASFNRMVNPIDVIPFFWTDLPGITANKIPVPVPLVYRFLLSIAEGALQIAGITYYHITEADTIGRIPISGNVPGIPPSDTLGWYNYWWKMEHKHDSYLKILGVKPLK